MADSQPVDALSTAFTVLAFNADNSQPASARMADWLLCSWTFSNLTPQTRSLTFAKGNLFKIRVFRDDQTDPIWQSPDPPDAGDLTVNVASNDNYSIPQDANKVEDAMPEQLPRIDLKSIVKDQNIDPKVELWLEFVPLAAELGQHFVAKLWR
jgi:hypothetical protein